MYHTTPTPGSQIGWTMEQHEAAAAALGAAAAAFMRYYCGAPRVELTSDYGRGMVYANAVAFDTAAMTLAKDAWRHANAAMSEADAIASALEGRA